MRIGIIFIATGERGWQLTLPERLIINMLAEDLIYCLQLQSAPAFVHTGIKHVRWLRVCGFHALAPALGLLLLHVFPYQIQPFLKIGMGWRCLGN